MLKSGDDFDFAQKTLNQISTRVCTREQNFHGLDAIGKKVANLEHLPHSAPADDRNDLVISDGRTDFEDGWASGHQRTVYGDWEVTVLPDVEIQLLLIWSLLRGLFEYFRVYSRVDFDLLILNLAGFFSILLVLALERNRQTLDGLPVIHGGLALCRPGSPKRYISFLQDVPICRIHEPADCGACCVYVHDAGFNVPYL